MNTLQVEFGDRFLDLAVMVLEINRLNSFILTKNQINRQLIRCATSAGANYQEACAAESRKDFIHKMQIVLKELRETHYWLQLIKRSKLLNESIYIQDKLLKENKELMNMTASSIITAKKGILKNV